MLKAFYLVFNQQQFESEIYIFTSPTCDYDTLNLKNRTISEIEKSLAFFVGNN